MVSDTGLVSVRTSQAAKQRLSMDRTKAEPKAEAVHRKLKSLTESGTKEVKLPKVKYPEVPWQEVEAISRM